MRGIVRDIARLYTSPVPENKRKAEEYLKQYADSIPEDAWATVGLAEAAQEFRGGNDSWADKAKGFAGNAISDAFGVIDAPSQAVLHGIDAATGGQDRGSPLSAAFDQLRNPTDHSDDINLRGALDKSETEGGRLLGLVDTIGTIGLDPLTYATFGASAVAKSAALAGGRGIVREGAERAAMEGAEQLTEMGVRRATRETAKTLERHNLGRALKDLGIEGGSRGARRRTFRETLEKSYISDGMTEQAARRAAQRSVAVMARPRVAAGVLDAVPGARRLADAAGEGAGALARTRPATWAADAFIPGARTRRMLGADVYDTMKEIGGTAQARKANSLEDLERHMVTLAHGAKMDEGDLARTLDALDEPRAAEGGALDGAVEQAPSGALPPRVQALVDEYTLAGQAEKAALVTELHAMRAEVDDILKGAGADPAKLHDLDTFVRRYLTDDGKKVVQKASRDLPAHDPARRLLGLSSDQGRLTARTPSLRDQPLRQVNDILEKDAGVGERLFDENPLRIGTRSKAEAQSIAIKEDMLADIEKHLVLEDGTPLIVRDVKDEAGVRAGPSANSDILKATEGYVTVDFGPIHGKAKVHPDIADDLKVYTDLVSDDQAIRQFGETMDKWMKLWRGYATVPIVGGTGFMSRNMQGNLLSNWVAGVRNPKLYTDAARVQLALMKAERKGVPVTAENLAKMLRGKNADHLARATIALRERGVISSSFFHTDLGKNLDTLAAQSNIGGLGKHTINPLDDRNFVLSTGQSMNARVEDNARIAHFLHVYGAHGDAKIAADSVKRFLFDYADLTEFERRVMRRVVPFYTFMRKNTPLMLRELAADPGKLARVERARRSAFQGDQDPKTEEGLDRFLPSYVREGQTGPAAGWLTDLVGGNGQQSLFAGPELPYNAAIETVSPVAEMAAQVPGLDAVLPDQWKNDEGFQGIAASIINLPGGGPNELVRFLIEEGTGVDMFTGGELDTARENRLLRFADVLAPAITKTTRLAQATGAAGSGGENETIELKARLLRNILGLNTQVVDDDASGGARYGVWQDIKDDIRALEDAGEALPSLDDLQADGILPDEPAWRKAVPGLRPSGGSAPTRRLFSG